VSDPLSETEAKRAGARGQLRQSLSETKSRLRPASIKQDLIDTAWAKAEDLADAVKARPVATAGIIAAAAVILLRKPLFGVLMRLTKEKDDGQ
jgi:ElaB/YqjD/DUF883 family membrane-anchored ribosome-binding protein